METYQTEITTLINEIRSFLDEYNTDNIWEWINKKEVQCAEWKPEFTSEIIRDKRTDIINDYTDMKPTIHKINDFFIRIHRFSIEILKYGHNTWVEHFGEARAEEITEMIERMIASIEKDVDAVSYKTKKGTYIDDKQFVSSYKFVPLIQLYLTTNPTLIRKHIIYLYLDGEPLVDGTLINKLRENAQVILENLKCLEGSADTLEAMMILIKKNKISKSHNNMY